MSSPWGVNLKKSANPPADLTGDVANTGVKEIQIEAPAFSGVQLKKTARPADYDGSAPNTGVKEVEHGTVPIALKSTDGGIRE